MTLDIRYVRLDSLEPDPTNSKMHDVDAIRDSIRAYGWRVPVNVDERTGLLAAGHGTTKAAWAMYRAREPLPRFVQADEDGMWLVPAVVGGASASDLDATGFNVAANRIQELEGYHQENLLRQLEELNAGAPDLFELLRFTGDEMDELLRRGGGALDDDEPGRADAPPRPGQDADTPLEDLEGREPKPVEEEPIRMIRCEACGHTQPSRV